MPPTASSVLCGCGRFMQVKKNSVTVEELLDDGCPYKLWDADLFICPECEVEIIAGFAREPLVEHWQPTYDLLRKRLAPIYPGRCAPEAVEPPEENPRERDDDDGTTYADPRDEREERLHR